MSLLTNSTTAFAGSKVILLGEHGVVHGTDALVIGLPRGLRTTVFPATGPVRLSVPAWKMEAEIEGPRPMDRALSALFQSLAVSRDGIRLTVEAAIPPRAGLGASASLAASCALAVIHYYGLSYSRKRLETAIAASERIFHENPSGIDATAVLSGGCLCYNRQNGARQVSASIPRLIVAHTGIDSSTADMIRTFAARKDTNPKDADTALKQMQTIVQRGVTALEAGDAETLGRLMNDNQKILRWFGVSCPDLDRICDIARQNGAKGAKLTGGGGGGCAIIIADEASESAICESLTSAGYRIL